ncbi:MAG: A/G-specific adenine glycosylase [Proteobacteria bacterium]|nr:A/G-specific adenine glycosylase [Pseudomonadota bacterium]
MITNVLEQPVRTAALEAPSVCRLLDWYDRHRRDLPWRAAPGETPDPYVVWLSEIILQQTTVSTAKPYFESLLALWPRVEDLAAADPDRVLHAWQGLGYYARARNLLKCARIVSEDLGGRFPDNERELQRLPGIGPYTAAAIASIAFGQKTVPVDGNVVRVLARLYALGEPLPGARRRIEGLARGLASSVRPGDFAQALMDLGAGVCTPRKPACGACPWRSACAGRCAPEAYPVKGRTRTKPTRRGVAFWAEDGNGAVLLRKRAEEGLLGGMMEFPSTDWRQAPWTDRQARAFAPVPAAWRRLPGVVRHTFTHFHLELAVLAGKAGASCGEGGPPDGIWCSVERFPEHPLPTLMKKVAAHALKHLNERE